MMVLIPDLAYEINGDAINLEQDSGCGEKVYVSLHRSHVALLAAELGIVRAPHDGEALRTIETLQRRMRALHRRIVHLDDWLHGLSDEHADLSYERAFSCAIRDLADEFCTELEPCDVSENEADKVGTESGRSSLMWADWLDSQEGAAQKCGASSREPAGT